MAYLEDIPRRVQARLKEYLKDRPHRSFKRTRRRDVPKNVKLPGYIRFTNDTYRTLWMFRKHFVVYVAVYLVVTTLALGIVQQQQFSSFTETLKSVGSEVFEGQFDGVTKTVVQFGAVVTGGLNEQLSEAQQVTLAMITILSWLVVVWLLRQLLAGNEVKVRDALYNAGAPIISTFCIAFLMLLQAVPGGLAVIIYITAYSTGWLQGGVEAMAFGLAALGFVILSLYWITSTFLAGLIVTLPGTYPMDAIRSAGQLSFGRRLPLLLRLLWLSLMILLAWALFLIPALLIDGALNIAWLPIVPVVVQLLTAFSVIFSTTYIYLLYRKLIENDN